MIDHVRLSESGAPMGEVARTAKLWLPSASPL
jgi:hypothetical protein